MKSNKQIKQAICSICLDKMKHDKNKWQFLFVDNKFCTTINGSDPYESYPFGVRSLNGNSDLIAVAKG